MCPIQTQHSNQPQQTICNLEETGVVISTEIPFKEAHDRFNRYPENLYLINNMEDIVVFLALPVLNSDNFLNILFLKKKWAIQFIKKSQLKIEDD